MNKTFCTLSMAGLSLLAMSSDAATVFETNTSGNAASLLGVGAGDSTSLPLSAADGGGTIDLNTIAAYNGGSAQTMGMDANGFGVGNSKWGNGPQGWTFTFSATVSFDGIGYNAAGGGSEGVGITYAGWIGSGIDDGGKNWSFNDATGTISVQGGNGPLFDFTGVGLPDIAAGDQINIEHNSGNGGSQMTQFTITPQTSVIPTPSAALLALPALGMVLRRRR